MRLLFILSLVTLLSISVGSADDAQGLASEIVIQGQPEVSESKILDAISETESVNAGSLSKDAKPLSYTRYDDDDDDPVYTYETKSYGSDANYYKPSSLQTYYPAAAPGPYYGVPSPQLYLSPYQAPNPVNYGASVPYASNPYSWVAQPTTAPVTTPAPTTTAGPTTTAAPGATAAPTTTAAPATTAAPVTVAYPTYGGYYNQQPLPYYNQPANYYQKPPVYNYAPPSYVYGYQNPYVTPAPATTTTTPAPYYGAYNPNVYGYAPKPPAYPTGYPANYPTNTQPSSYSAYGTQPATYAQGAYPQAYPGDIDGFYNPRYEKSSSYKKGYKSKSKSKSYKKKKSRKYKKGSSRRKSKNYHKKKSYDSRKDYTPSEYRQPYTPSGYKN